MSFPVRYDSLQKIAGSNKPPYTGYYSFDFADTHWFFYLKLHFLNPLYHEKRTLLRLKPELNGYIRAAPPTSCQVRRKRAPLRPHSTALFVGSDVRVCGQQRTLKNKHVLTCCHYFSNVVSANGNLNGRAGSAASVASLNAVSLDRPRTCRASRVIRWLRACPRSMSSMQCPSPRRPTARQHALTSSRPTSSSTRFVTLTLDMLYYTIEGSYEAK